MAWVGQAGRGVGSYGATSRRGPYIGPVTRHRAGVAGSTGECGTRDAVARTAGMAPAPRPARTRSTRAPSTRSSSAHATSTHSSSTRHRSTRLWSIAGADDPQPVGDAWFAVTDRSVLALDDTGARVRSWDHTVRAKDRDIVVGPSRVWVFGLSPDDLNLTGEWVGPGG